MYAIFCKYSAEGKIVGDGRLAKNIFQKMEMPIGLFNKNKM